MPSIPRSVQLSLLVMGSLIVIGQYLQGLVELHQALAPYSLGLASGVLVLVLVGTVGILGGGLYWLRGRGQKDPAPEPMSAIPPNQVTSEHVKTSFGSMDDLIAKLQDDIQRHTLQQEAEHIKTELADETLHVVIFGTGSAGKTSLVNALLGRWVGETAATLGTTQSGSAHTYTIPGVTGSILLTDTPGLLTVGGEGEEESRALAEAADLLIFVVSGDLLASEYTELMQLARLGKRAILALNKIDQIIPADREVILSQLRTHVADAIASESIIGIAANPQPLKVKHIAANGSVTIEFEDQDPETQPLVAEMARILAEDGHHLRLATALLKSQALAATAHDIHQHERDHQARQVVERTQWSTAAVVALTPLPALDLLAAVATNARMIGELHDLFERQISLAQAKAVARTMTDLLVKLGGVELAAQGIGAILKASPLALIGLPLQAASAAYLTRIAGLSYLEWLKSEDPWTEATIAEQLHQQFQQHQQLSTLLQFGQQALQTLPEALRTQDPVPPLSTPLTTAQSPTAKKILH